MHDSKSLLDNGRHAGSIYIGGIALECALKFAVCDQHDRIQHVEDYKPREDPELGKKLTSSEGHNLKLLLKVTTMTLDEKGEQAFSRVEDRWSIHVRYSTQSIDYKAAASFWDDIDYLCNYVM